MQTLQLNPSSTALVLIDLQQGIVSRQGVPHSTEQVITHCAALAQQFRQHGAPVIYVRVDLADFIQLNVDSPARAPGSPPPSAAVSELVPAAGFQEGDILITKRHWSAFPNTGLHEQLKKHNIDTIVIGGVATNFGVESTARDASGLGINVVFAEDAMTSLAPALHQFSIEHIFPRIGRVRSSAQIGFAS